MVLEVLLCCCCFFVCFGIWVKVSVLLGLRVVVVGLRGVIVIVLKKIGL